MTSLTDPSERRSATGLRKKRSDCSKIGAGITDPRGAGRDLTASTSKGPALLGAPPRPKREVAWPATSRPDPPHAPSPAPPPRPLPPRGPPRPRARRRRARRGPAGRPAQARGARRRQARARAPRLLALAGGPAAAGESRVAPRGGDRRRGGRRRA